MLKVLIVDDEPIVSDGLRYALSRDNMNLEVSGVASDGQMALEMFQKLEADIVLTDIRMPFLNGLELTREIKKISEGTVVILLSAYDDFKYAQEAIRIGAFDYILKPIDLEVLEGTIQKAVKARIEASNKNKEVPILQAEDLKFFTAEHYKLPLQLEDELFKVTKRADTALSLIIFDQIWNELEKKKYSLELMKRQCFDLIGTLTKAIVETGEDADILFRQIDPWTTITKFKTQEDLNLWMRKMIKTVNEYIGLNKNGKNKKTIKMVLKFIEENYQDKYISLGRIADNLYITPNYLSTLFKQEMGQGFSEYLSEYRIERAKKLLKDVRLKIYEISDAVGYVDPHYFSKIFKNVTGLTPKEYREKIE